MGVVQVFLLNQPVCGFIILMALGLSSWTMAGFCVFGTMCSTFTAMFLLHPGDKIKEPLFEPSTMLGLYVARPVSLVRVRDRVVVKVCLEFLHLHSQTCIMRSRLLCFEGFSH